MKLLVFSLSIFLIAAACGHRFLSDPNANVILTSQYENGPITIHWSNNSKPQIDCKEKSEIKCATELYKEALALMISGEKLAEKKLYLSASLDYMLALTRLTEAEIRTNRIKNWKVEEIKLRQKIKKQINFCKIKINSLHRRHR